MSDSIMSRIEQMWSEQRREEAKTMCAKRKPTEDEISRAMVIGKWFFGWNDITGICPITLGNKHWHKKVCALFEWIAVLESDLKQTAEPNNCTAKPNDGGGE